MIKRRSLLTVFVAYILCKQQQQSKLLPPRSLPSDRQRNRCSLQSRMYRTLILFHITFAFCQQCVSIVQKLMVSFHYSRLNKISVCTYSPRVGINDQTERNVNLRPSVFCQNRPTAGLNVLLIRRSQHTQEAQLPQRNSASAAHMEGGWG